MKHRSSYFSKPNDLITEKDRLWGEDEKRRTREMMVRAFYNGQELETAGENERDDGPGMTNHLIGYRNLQSLVEGVFAVYATTNSLIEIKCETGNPEADLLTGERLAKSINEAIYSSGEFEALWSSVAGELCLTGRAPLVFGRYGWCPGLAPYLLLPENSSGVPKKITYAFAPCELNYASLKELEAASQKGDKYIDAKVVGSLLEVLTKQIKGEGNSQDSSIKGRETGLNPLNESVYEDVRTTVKAWKYYEVKFNDKKNRMEVSSTLITERINLEAKSPATDGEALVVSYHPAAFEDPTHWLHTMIVDSQIGGLKTFAAARGIAELTYNSDTDSEELMNEIMAGEKIRARPKFTLGPQANRQQVNEWNVYRESIIPHDVNPAQLSGSGANLGAVMSLLNQTSSGLTGGSFSNTGRDSGELRQQALERQNRNASMSNNRMSAIYTAGDRVAREIVRRFLVLDIKPGTDGYDDIAWVRDDLEQQKIDATLLKKLGKVKYGRFCYLKVRLARSVGSGDRDSEMEVSKLLMENIDKFDPQVRPLILRKWVNLVTRDPNLAELLVTLPEIVINGQKIDAEGEFPTILRRATIGQNMPISPEDVGEDHVPVHLLDLQAFLAQSAFRDFTELDLRGYAGVVDHITAHLQAMASVPASAGAAKVYQQQFQQLVNAAKPIINKVKDQQEQAQTMGMDPEKQAKIILDTNRLQLEAQKEGRAHAEFAANVKQRNDREAHLARAQYAKETEAAKKHRLEQEKLALEKEKLAHEKSKPAPGSKKSSSKSTGS